MKLSTWDPAAYPTIVGNITEQEFTKLMLLETIIISSRSVQYMSLLGILSLSLFPLFYYIWHSNLPYYVHSVSTNHNMNSREKRPDEVLLA
jgi:hypothetical protein